MTAGPARWPRAPFVAAVLLGSFLLFLIQPLVARQALPRLGGAPAVWLSASLVYQALLLGGYLWAHRLGDMPPARARVWHLGLLAVAALWLPVGLWSGLADPRVSPLLSVPALLLLSVGPLFVAVSAGAPLIGRWYAAAHPGRDPYPLYAASNFGSFAGLLFYPFLLEPLLPVRAQSLLWSGLYLLLVPVIAWAAWRLPAQAPARAAEEAGPPLSRARVLRWVALAAIPSGLMLSTTAHLTTDLVALPLIWVVPLALYLLSFTVAFAQGRLLADAIAQLTPILVLIGGGLAFFGGTREAWFQATLGLLLLFAVSVTLHARLYDDRPPPARLTAFYLSLAAGGALGGLFTALIAPLLFDWTYEHPLLLLAAAAALPARALHPALTSFWAKPWAGRAEVAACALVALLFVPAAGLVDANLELRTGAQVALFSVAGLVAGRRVPFVLAILALMLSLGGIDMLRGSWAGARERSFFGVYTVGRDGDTRILMHGTTLHGLQRLQSGNERQPTTYYTPQSGIGLALAQVSAGAEVGLVGLGTGTLACYRRPGQRYSFYEIDPTVVGIAREKFSFLRACAPDARVVLGDARLSLAAERPGRFDLLAIDAFSSDAIPIHLVTREALRAYGRALRPDGLLLVHISNRYIELEPVLAAVADVDGWHAAVRDHAPTTQEKDAEATRSVWVALSRRPEPLRALMTGSGELWSALERRPGTRTWTDDYASVLPHLKKAWPDLP